MNPTTLTRYEIEIDGERYGVGTAAELAVALDVLQGQHDRVVLEQLRPHLAEIIAGPVGLAAIFKVLAPEDQLYLIDALGPRLASLLPEAHYLRDLLASLAVVAVEERLLETLQPKGLRALLQTAEELAEVLEWIYGECDALVLQTLGAEYVRDLLQSGYELSLVLHALDHSRQAELLEQLGWDRVVALVHDRRDLAYLLRCLPAELGSRLLEHISPQRLRQLIAHEHGWRYLVARLEDDEIRTLCRRLGGHCDAE